MSTRLKQMTAIIIAFFIMFTVCVFLIPFPKGTTFWIAYIAEIIALTVQIPVFKIACENPQELRSKVLGFPVFRVGYIYLGVQTVVSIILFILGAVISSFPVWISVVLCVIVLGLAFICSMGAEIAREEIENIETISRVNTDFMMSLRTKSKNIIIKTDDKELKNNLEKLFENIRYSDPVSNEKIADIENDLKECINNLEYAVINKDIEKSFELCRKAEIILNERNTMCKMTK